MTRLKKKKGTYKALVGLNDLMMNLQGGGGMDLLKVET